VNRYSPPRLLNKTLGPGRSLSCFRLPSESQLARSLLCHSPSLLPVSSLLSLPWCRHFDATCGVTVPPLPDSCCTLFALPCKVQGLGSSCPLSVYMRVSSHFLIQTGIPARSCCATERLQPRKHSKYSQPVPTAICKTADRLKCRTNWNSLDHMTQLRQSSSNRTTAAMLA
jgi:hypothetical protein